MNLQLVRVLRADGNSTFRLDVTTDLDGSSYAADWYTPLERDPQSGEKLVTLFVKPNVGTTATQGVAYQVPLGETNPIEAAADYLLVQLKGADGTLIDSMRLNGGGKLGDVSDPDLTGKPG